MTSKQRLWGSFGIGALLLISLRIVYTPAFGQTSPAKQGTSKTDIFHDVVHALPPGGPAPRQRRRTCGLYRTVLSK